MGWTSSSEWPTKESMVDYLVNRSMGETLKVVAHAVRGQTLWAVVEYVKDGYYKVGHRAILCFLMRGYGKGEGWGYKDMDESMGPCEVSCPLKYLDMVPDPGGYATEWRAKVRAAAAQRSAKQAARKGLAVGARVRLVQGCTIMGDPVTEPLRVISLKPILVEIGPNHVQVRVQPRHIAEILPPETSNNLPAQS